MKKIIENSLNNTIKNLDMPKVEFSLQIPKNKEHGDLATNIAFLLAKKVGNNPLNIAKDIKTELEKTDLFSDIMIANPGFINMKINPKSIVENLNIILLKKDSYGKNDFGKGKKILLEFVSANPTGPLTVGHGRGAILGDCLKEALCWNGFNVETEYYYNNAGRQMRVLAESVLARYNEINGKDIDFPEDGYQGEYIKEIALKFKNENGKDILENELNKFKDFAENEIFNNIKLTLKDMGIVFSSFFNEKKLYDNKNIYTVIDKLKERKLIYEKDGATWFSGTKVGRENDRVLIKKTGEPTYRLPDMAYHITKFERNYDIIIDIFGADHMDAYPDVLAVLNELGHDTNKVKVLIHQFVSIIKDGSPIKMSTRKANFITLQKLIKEVGIDAVRFFFIMRNMNSHLNFDLDIAKEKSEKNPVYYIQYAHARICTVINKANIDLYNPNLNLLNQDDDIKLIYKLLDFENIISKLKDTLEPQILSNYLYDLASLFHKYYAHNRIITANIEISKARLALIKGTRIVIKNGLKVLGITAPESM